jgi:hypothetical protein
MQRKDVNETRHAGRLFRRIRSRRAVVTALAAFAVGAVASAALGGGTVANQWLWFKGDQQTFIASPKGPAYPANSLLMTVSGDLDVGAGHIRFGAGDGNYEFEHGSGTPFTHLNSYYEGTPTRTPILIGGNDGQDVLSLLVQGKLGQAHDLQDWEAGNTVQTAIDGSGNLRLGDVVLKAMIVNGHVELIAVLPDGSTQLLAFGSPNQAPGTTPAITG